RAAPMPTRIPAIEGGQRGSGTSSSATTPERSVPSPGSPLRCDPRGRSIREGKHVTAGNRLRNPLRRMAVVLTAFLAIVVYGAVGYAVIEHDSVIDALFMTV